MSTSAPTSPAFELRFNSLFIAGRAYAFPCDAAGKVNLDDLSDNARNNYFYARSVVGREFLVPAVQLRLERYRGSTND